MDMVVEAAILGDWRGDGGSNSHDWVDGGRRGEGGRGIRR